MRGFRRVRNLRFWCRRRQLGCAIRLAVEHQAVGVVAQAIEGSRGEEAVERNFTKKVLKLLKNHPHNI